MNSINAKLENGVLTLSLSGKIDSLNAFEIENNIKQIREQYAADSILLDCDQLETISSAGLRVILRLKQDMDDTRMINVHSEVYEILDITGFTEMMDVQKAYRVLSLDGCQMIGQGANGKVYRYDRDTIVKVYLNPDSLPEIHRTRQRPCLSRKEASEGGPGLPSAPRGRPSCLTAQRKAPSRPSDPRTSSA